MPIFADEIQFEQLTALAKYHICAECGALLRLSWSNERNCYMLRCQRFESHTGIRRLGRDPEILEIKNKLKGEPLPMDTTALTKLSPQEMQERVNLARFPKDLTVADRQLLAKVSLEYGLDPVFGELMIYQGRPYITIDARRRKAQETGMLDGINARPATKAERTARQVNDGDYLFIAEVWVKGASHPFEGWGTVKNSETIGSPHLPIVKDPAAMAEKRAEAQALRRAFHLPLPSFEEINEDSDLQEPTPDEPQSKSSPPTPAVRPADLITQPQRQKVFGDAHRMGYTDAELHTIIKTKWGVTSINNLNKGQASTLIDMIAKGEGLTTPDAEKDIKDFWPEEENEAAHRG